MGRTPRLADPGPTAGPVTGTYNWVVSYSGDANNNPVASTWERRQRLTRPTRPRHQRQPRRVTLSRRPADLDRLGDALGRVPARPGEHHLRSLRLGVAPVDTESVTVSGDGTYTTPTGYTLPTTGTVTGTYQWVATYSGDANNGTASRPRGTAEQTVVSPASPTLITTASPGHDALEPPLPATISDSATLSGGYLPGRPAASPSRSSWAPTDGLHHQRRGQRRRQLHPPATPCPPPAR